MQRRSKSDDRSDFAAGRGSTDRSRAGRTPLGSWHVLRLAGPFGQRADLHCIPGLPSALAACADRNTSAPGDGESGARARPQRFGIVPRCGPACTSMCSRSVGSTRYAISSKRHPTSPSRNLGRSPSIPLRRPCRKGPEQREWRARPRAPARTEDPHSV
jgi:hypothetical protein